MIANTTQEFIIALRLYERLYMRGRRQQFLAKLFHKPWRLLDLNDIASLVKVDGRSYGGVRTVCMNEIMGSVGRSRDFNRGFLPIQKHTQPRWVSIAAARIIGISLPIVDLVLVGDVYYVRDGHHRISVAKAFGELEIDAEVTIWNTSRLAPPPISEGDVMESLRPDEMDKAA